MKLTPPISRLESEIEAKLIESELDWLYARINLLKERRRQLYTYINIQAYKEGERQ